MPVVYLENCRKQNFCYLRVCMISSNSPLANNEDVTFVVASGSVLISSNLLHDINAVAINNKVIYLLNRFIFVSIKNLNLILKPT